MLELYYVPRTRSARPRWMLEEMGIPYELHRLDPKKGENRSPEYLAVHPLGHVPALKDDHLLLYESAAILAYLADKFPEKKMAPAPGTAERGKWYQWLFFGMTTLEEPLLTFANHTRIYPEERRDAAKAEAAGKRLGEVLPVVEKAIKGKSFLVGDGLTAADILIGNMIALSIRVKLLDEAKFPELARYGKSVLDRPAYQRSVAD